MEDWIYIVLVVGYVIFSTWKDLKKENTDAEAVPADPTSQEGEEFCTEDRKEAESPETKSKIEQILAMLGKPQTPQPTPVSQPVTPTPTSVKKTSAPPQKQAPQRKNSINYELRSAQGARKAFIYSEIFKRKYE